MVNQSDLTLQGTNTASNCPVGLYEPTIPLPASNYRTAPPSYGQPSPTTTTKSKYMQANSPLPLDYPKGWEGFLYFQSRAVLGLPVSTTSYSRYVVSTVPSPISTANNGRSLIDTDGAKTPRNPVLLPYLYIVIISLSGLTLSIYLKSYSNIHVLK